MLRRVTSAATRAATSPARTIRRPITISETDRRNPETSPSIESTSTDDASPRSSGGRMVTSGAGDGDDSVARGSSSGGTVGSSAGDGR